jgi:hypothetical protein
LNESPQRKQGRLAFPLCEAAFEKRLKLETPRADQQQNVRDSGP